jgi:integrase
MERVAQADKQGTEKAKRRGNTPGQIIPRGEDTWLVRIFTGRDGNGKRRYLNKTVRGKKKDAQDYLSNTLVAISTGTFVEPSPMTLNGYLDRWLEGAAKARVSERTYRDYEWLLKCRVRDKLGSEKLSDIRPLNIQTLYTAMQKQGLSPRSVRALHAVLSSAFKQAVRWQMLSRNPCEAVELPRYIRKEMQAFSPKEAKRFLEAAANDSHGIIFAFALSTGMRPEEYLALKWSDIDLSKGTATVQRTLQRRKGGGWYYGDPKTPRSRRTIPLPASIVRSLIEHKRRQGEARLKAGVGYQQHNLVFASLDGTPFMLSNLTRRHFKPILKSAKLPGTFRLYDLRHSCATVLLAAGENPKVVSERLGHASIVLTLDTYSHVLPDMQQEATRKLESILFEGVREQNAG